MDFPEQSEADGHAQLEHFNDWTCSRCSKKISATRPPVFNADNCSCDEVAAWHIDHNGYYSEPATYEHAYNSEVTAPIYHNQAQSVASSSASVPCPEGPEIHRPDLQVGNPYLPLVADPGLNEIKHQRTASFNSDLSYPLQRFLGEQKTPSAVYGTSHLGNTSSKSNFLSQEMYLQSSKEVKKRSPHSKMSWVSGSDGSGDASVESWGMDPLAGAGMWDEVSGYGNTASGYAMVLSGTSDYAAVFDEQDEEMN